MAILNDEYLSRQISDEISITTNKAAQNETMPYLLVKIQERDLWNRFVQNCKIYDFYHTWYYHSLEKSGEPILFVYQEDDTIIAFPLLKRSIPNSEYTDFTSVYGYAGPISNRDFDLIDQSTMDGFIQAFLKFLKDQKNISVFCRLHPIINHDILVERFGSLVNNGKTIAIQLTQTLEAQRSRYRRQFRSKIRQLRDKGFFMKKAESKEEIQAFVKIYNENMARVQAESYYYFNESYFFNMLNSGDFASSVLLLYLGEEITCGAFVTFSNNIMQFHLAATNNKYLQEGPMKLLIDESTIVGREHNMEYLHLGGGVGGNEDSLFDFKSGFSDTILNFKTWRFVANQEEYNKLVHARWDNQPIKSDFFPLYREPINVT